MLYSVTNSMLCSVAKLIQLKRATMKHRNKSRLSQEFELSECVIISAYNKLLS